MARISERRIAEVERKLAQRKERAARWAEIEQARQDVDDCEAATWSARLRYTTLYEQYMAELRKGP